MECRTELRAKLIENGHDPDEVLSPPGAWQPYHAPRFPRSSDLTGPWVFKHIDALFLLWGYFKEARAAKKRTEAEIVAWKAGRASGLASGLATGRAVERATIKSRLMRQGIDLDELLPPEELETAGQGSFPHSAPPFPQRRAQ